MKKAKTLLLLLSASLLASCAAIGSGSESTSEADSKGDASASSQTLTSIEPDAAKAKLSTTLLNMKGVDTFGLSLKGNAKVKENAKTVYIYNQETVSEFTSNLDYSIENLALDAAVRGLGSSSCAMSASFTADVKYALTTEREFSSDVIATYDGPVSGKGYYEEGMLYGDASGFIRAVNPSMDAEQAAQAKVKLPYSLPALDWAMVIKGMNFLEEKGFASSASSGENGVCRLSYKISCLDYLKAVGNEVPSDYICSGGIEVWLSFDSSRILGIGASSDMKYCDGYQTSSWTEIDGSRCEGGTTSCQTNIELDLNLNGTLSYEGVSVENVPDPDSFTLVQSGGSENYSPEADNA